MAQSVIQKQLRPLSGLLLEAMVSGNGTYSMAVDASQVNEVVFQVYYGNKVRCSMTVTGEQFRAGYAFLDYTVVDDRFYAQFNASGSTMTVSSFTKPSSWSSVDVLVLYR